MSSVPTEDSNIFSFSVSPWWPGTMTMEPPRLKWLFMRSSPESNHGFSQWIMKWWVPHFKSSLYVTFIWQVIFSNGYGPNMPCLTLRSAPEKCSSRASSPPWTMIVSQIIRKPDLWYLLAEENTWNIWLVIRRLKPSSKLTSSSSSVFRIAYVIFVCYIFIVSWFVGRGRWHSRSMRCIQAGWGMCFLSVRE